MSDPLLIFHVDLNFLSMREDYLRRWLHTLAGLGYNAILWEVEDKVRWETCPECVYPEAMDKTAFRALLAEARSLGMVNIPLLQTIGHAEYVLKHEPYVDWRENPAAHDCYCTSRPEVRAFLKRWIEEYLDLFEDAPYFHLGGDEAYEFGKCPVCRARAAEIGHNRLYAEHILDLAQPIFARGVRPGIWCDMILKYPDQVHDIPTGFVIWDWNYWDSDDPPPRARVWGHGLIGPEEVTPELRQALPDLVDETGHFTPFHTVDHLRRLNYDVILSSASRSHGDSIFAGLHNVHAPNVVGAARKARRSGLLGTCITSWAIRVHCWETQWFWLALAARAFAEPEQDFATIVNRVADECLGLDGKELCQALVEIGTPVPFARRNESGIQWNNLKDPVPAPTDWVVRMLAGWRDKDGGQPYRDHRAEVAAAAEQIRLGANRLHLLAEQASGGYPFLAAWSRAAHHQFWAARVAAGIFAKADGEPSPTAELIAVAEQAKDAFAAWAATWLTPQSARQVADLTHDPACLYLRQNP